MVELTKNQATVIKWIFGIVGAYYLFFPHSTHIANNLDFGLTHGVHMLIGVILIVSAILIKSKRKRLNIGRLRGRR